MDCSTLKIGRMMSTPWEVAAEAEPFRHAQIPQLIAPPLADALLVWLRDAAPWKLRVESFYEQHEFSLLNSPPPADLGQLTAPRFLDELRDLLRMAVNAPRSLALVDIAAHRLTLGQTIRVHNDYLEGEETHRVLVQVNEGWSVERGGLLMLFGSSSASDIRKLVLPTHGSGFAFEISRVSYHAVSTIKEGERFTLVYTFKGEGQLA
jgi:hypothetical protein